MAKQAPIVYRDWQNGMVDSVANAILPDNYVRLLENCYTDEFAGNELGKVKGRKGTTLVGSQIVANKPILGLFTFIDQTQSPTYPIATINNSAGTSSRTYYFNGTVWAEIGTATTAFTAGLTMRFDTFLDYVFCTNGTDAVQTWNGNPATDWGTTNAASAPTGTLIKNFNDQMCIGGNSTYPSRLYYSSTPNVSNAITWPVQYVDFNPDDNDRMTALENSSGLMLVFKNRSVYTWNGISSSPNKIIDVGTPTQESVVTVKGITLFFAEVYDSCAIFMYTGQYPQEISKGIQKLMDAVPVANYSSVVSWKDADHAYFYLGNITYQGESFTNVVARYCVSKGSWCIYTIAHVVTAATTRVASGARSVIIGDSLGNVLTWNSGFTDNGTNINSRIRTKELEFGSRHAKKTIPQIIAYSSQPQGATLGVRIDGKSWQPLKSLSKPEEVIKCNLSGNWFEFEIRFANTGVEPFMFDGFEFVDVDIEPYVK